MYYLIKSSQLKHSSPRSEPNYLNIKSFQLKHSSCQKNMFTAAPKVLNRKKKEKRKKEVLLQYFSVSFFNEKHSDGCKNMKNLGQEMGDSDEWKGAFDWHWSNHCYLDLSHTYNNIYFSVSVTRVHRTRETSLKEEKPKQEVLHANQIYMFHTQHFVYINYTFQVASNQQIQCSIWN